MLALTIRQPWAWAILVAGKDVENRTWPTSYRGPIAIHAARGMTHLEWCQFLDFYRHSVGWHTGVHIDGPPLPEPAELVRGAIVGTAEVVDCVTEHPSPWFEGPRGFVLDNVVALPEPIPCKGALGLWDVPAMIAHQVARSIFGILR